MTAMTRLAATAAESAVPIANPPKNERQDERKDERRKDQDWRPPPAPTTCGGSAASRRLRKLAGAASFKFAAAIASRIVRNVWSLSAQAGQVATCASTSRACPASSSPSISACSKVSDSAQFMSSILPRRSMPRAAWFARGRVRARQFQLLLPVDDRSGLEQHRRHPGVAQHDQLVVAVDAGRGVDELAAAVAHQRQRVMRRV